MGKKQPQNETPSPRSSLQVLLSPWKKHFEQHPGDFSAAFLLAAAAQGPKVPEHFGGRLRLLKSFPEQVSTEQTGSINCKVNI